MRAAVLGIAVWLAPFAADAQLVRVQQPTNVAFEASNQNGMLVVAENGGTAYAPGRYRFVRIDREAGRPLEQVDILVGSVRGEVLFGWRPEARPASHAFHYAIVPAGEYALVYMDSSANNVVSATSRWVCANDAAPIYTVGAGAITVVLAPDRIPYDLI